MQKNQSLLFYAERQALQVNIENIETIWKSICVHFKAHSKAKFNI